MAFISCHFENSGSGAFVFVEIVSELIVCFCLVRQNKIFGRSIVFCNNDNKIKPPRKLKRHGYEEVVEMFDPLLG